MKIVFFIIIMIIAAQRSVFSVEESNPKLEQKNLDSLIAGDWSGELDAGAMKLILVLHVTQDTSEMLTAKIDCVQQGMVNMPVDVITLHNKTLKCEIKKLMAAFDGNLDIEKSEISGKFIQARMSFPLTFKRGIISAQPLKRPQEPTQPYPYIEEEVSFENKVAGVKLSGTLTLPRSPGPHSVALLIAGSGRQNRNEEVAGHKVFLVLADHLTKKGIASLRVDKRGVGQSTGDYELATTEDFASDVLAGVNYLKTRKEMNSIGLIGHSEGGLIAPLVANKSKDIAFIVLMAAPAVKGEEILLSQGLLIQRVDGIPEEQIMLDQKLREETFSILKKEANSEIAEKQLQEVMRKHLLVPQAQRNSNSTEVVKEENYEAVIKKINTPWFRYFLSYDPAHALKLVKIPILALNGELDLQVPSKQNLPVITTALKKAENRDYKAIELPQLNHLFQTCQTGSPMEYAKIDETVSPLALNLISDWILERKVKNSK